MLTSAAPSITRALQGVFTPQQLSSFLNAAANCAQPLQHRGGVSFQNGNVRYAGGLGPADGWNPAQYRDLFPSSGQPDIEAPGPGGYKAGDWYSTYYGSPNFDLSTQLTQSLNQYIAQNHYGGTTLNVEGDTYATNITTENLSAFGVVANRLNGEPAPGTPEARGPSGPQGGSGVSGAAGFGFVFAPFFGAFFGGGGGNPNGLDLLARQMAADALRRLRALENALKGARPTVTLSPKRVMTNATFDADNCRVVPQFEELKVTKVQIAFGGQ